MQKEVWGRFYKCSATLRITPHPATRTVRKDTWRNGAGTAPGWTPPSCPSHFDGTKSGSWEVLSLLRLCKSSHPEISDSQATPHHHVPGSFLGADSYLKKLTEASYVEAVRSIFPSGDNAEAPHAVMSHLCYHESVAVMLPYSLLVL